jgi:hypothetical protein
MAHEASIAIFGSAARLRLGSPLATGHLTMSIIGRNDTAWSQVFIYDPVSQIMDTDIQKLRQAIMSYRSGVNKTLKILAAISETISGIRNGIGHGIRHARRGSRRPSFFGNMFVILLAAVWLLVALYTFTLAAPVTVIAYGLGTFNKIRLQKEAENVKRNALMLFSRASGCAIEEEGPSPVARSNPHELT